MSPVWQILNNQSTRTRELLQICDPKHRSGIARSLVVFDRITPEGISAPFRHKTGFFMFNTKNVKYFLHDRNLKLPFCNDK